VKTVLYERLGLLEKLTGQNDHTGGSITDFGVLREGDIDEGLGRWVDDV
jgi:hypothetical protein